MHLNEFRLKSGIGSCHGNVLSCAAARRAQEARGSEPLTEKCAQLTNEMIASDLPNQFLLPESAPK